ncbi:MAG: S-adenosylmethionine:tRNA ribosyltransferase-isomerase [Acidobacteriota bacterium]
MKDKLLVVSGGELCDSTIEFLPDFVQSGDLLVINDAATLPASLFGRDQHNRQVEVRLSTQLNASVWQAVILGEGDWQTPTENRPSPPQLQTGEKIIFSDDFQASVLRKSEISDRLLHLEFNLSNTELWRGIYRYGKPVQYAYMNKELKLWSVQNVYGSRPWAVEMPSAGHAFNWQLLLRLIRKGVQIASLTHGAGLSSTGDAGIDAVLPLAEKFEIPPTTMEMIRQTRSKRGRVIAVGTSVVRALESASLGLAGFTELKLSSGHKLQFVDGIITGTHEVSESHYQLLGAFLPASILARVSQHLDDHDYLTHEFGDACLIIAGG